jgi:hypothetical protein
MQRHLNVLGFLYLIWGGLSLLVGLIMLMLAFGAGTLVRYAAAGRPGADLAAELTAATFGVLAVVAVLWGVVHAANGAALRRRRPWSRPLGLALSVLNLTILPFGTALGVYGLWVLLNNEVRGLFQPPPA